MKKTLIDYQQMTIQYHEWGSGDRLLIALPGYGDVARSYAFLEAALGTTHTILAIDLPGHTAVKWNKNAFHPNDFIQIIELLLAERNQQRFEIIGHSFGGRIIFSILAHFQKQLNHIYLVAPDGLSKDLKYSPHLPSFLRRIVYRIILSPKRLLQLSAFLFRLGLLNYHSNSFLQKQLKTTTQRHRLALCWNSLSAFHIKLDEVKKILKETEIRVDLFMGKRDRIIPPQSAKQLSDGMSNVHTYLLDGGHLLLGAQLGKQLKSLK